MKRLKCEGGGEGEGTGGSPSRLRGEKVGISGLPNDITRRLPEAGGGEGDGEDPAEHWWAPQPEKPGQQLLADFDGLSLVHHGDDGDAHVLRRLK